MGGKKKEAKEKPLDKMTAPELREIAKEIAGVVGVHGMNKPELLSAIKKDRGIEEAPARKSGSVRVLKKKIKELKAAREKALQSEDEKMAAIYRSRITRLKKKTRRAA
ncbi:MAG: transcription termination factor Rho [Desulfobacterales bacterium]|nr:transcription termination factor Rho [Desulfobacterales bacterium]